MKLNDSHGMKLCRYRAPALAESGRCGGGDLDVTIGRCADVGMSWLDTGERAPLTTGAPCAVI